MKFVLYGWGCRDSKIFLPAGIGATQITLVDDPEGDIQEIRELRDSFMSDDSTKPC